MAFARDFDLVERIFLAIRPGDGFPGLNGGTGQDSEIGSWLLEYNFPVFGMNIFFHGLHLATAMTRRSTGRKAAIIAADCTRSEERRVGKERRCQRATGSCRVS